MKDFEELKQKLNITNLTAETLQSLIKKKDKEAKMEKRLIRTGLLTLTVIAVLIVYLYFRATIEGTGGSALSFILNDPILLTIFAFLFYLIHLINYYKKKFDKAEKDVDEIREDIIDRSSDIWKTPEEWSQRYEIFKFLKETKDIDLFHK